MPIFFSFKRLGLAFTDVSLLTGLTMYFTKVLHGATKGKTSYFLVPYCAWLSYATYLSGTTWYLNRHKQIPRID